MAMADEFGTVHVSKTQIVYPSKRLERGQVKRTGTYIVMVDTGTFLWDGPRLKRFLSLDAALAALRAKR